MQHSKRKRNAFVNGLHLALDVILVSIAFVSGDALLGVFSHGDPASFYPESYYFALLLQIIVSLLVSETIFRQYEDFTSKGLNIFAIGVPPFFTGIRECAGFPAGGTMPFDRVRCFGLRQTPNKIDLHSSTVVAFQAGL